jgi:AcrR family transcriptional regulator
MIETIVLMQKARRSDTATDALDPTPPADLGEEPQRLRIVEAMIETCAEKTYAATTIADIVKRAGISRTTFYKRFANKRACFDAALDTCIFELRTAAVVADDPADSPPQTVRKATAAILDLLAAKPALAQLVMIDAVTVEPAILERYRSLLIPALESLWDRAGESRRASAADPFLAFGRGQVLVFNQIAAGRTAQLPDLLPDLVYLAVLPFAGHEEAARQAQMATEDSGAKG